MISEAFFEDGRRNGGYRDFLSIPIWVGSWRHKSVGKELFGVDKSISRVVAGFFIRDPVKVPIAPVPPQGPPYYAGEGFRNP